MFPLAYFQPVDYLVIGHLACDLGQNQKMTLGGTAGYASLTALSLGLRVGMITSWGSEIPLGVLEQIPKVNYPTEKSTQFENLITPHGRIQYIHYVASPLGLNLIPDVWRNPPIVHLAPIAQEVDPLLARDFSSSFVGLTPQGWLRTWDRKGLIQRTEWPEASFVLQRAGATVISLEDVEEDENLIEEMAASSRVLVVTEADQGCRIYWNGDVRRIRPPEVSEVDSTGAGDIFAAAFFSRLYQTRDPWEAGRFATYLASLSVTRTGLESVPTHDEIQGCMIEVL
jgi:sugar/nucleoside kinase (ribokinase family)